MIRVRVRVWVRVNSGRVTCVGGIVTDFMSLHLKMVALNLYAVCV